MSTVTPNSSSPKFFYILVFLLSIYAATFFVSRNKIPQPQVPNQQMQPYQPPPQIQKEQDSKGMDQRIIFVLDESGSMGPYKNSVIESFNSFVKNHQDKAAELKLSNPKAPNVIFTLIQFNDNVHFRISNTPIQNVPLLTNSNYSPNGSTALFDSIGEAFHHHKEFSKVILVILTDGEENSSKKFDRPAISKLIEEFKNENGKAWNIIYLSSDPLLVQQGDSIGASHTPDSGTNNVLFSMNRISSVLSKTAEATSSYIHAQAYSSGSSKARINVDYNE